ncbi:PREDICTED: caspase-8 [Nicrophorus vespilloides]|uniref:Caspase-8 n=1 Tax=Nicrophorus vespilloides TaxID=110193 RepID=A0ABM1M2B3_NICVS|nr:PREDICTED: caspase-8 [Nicrophorus vespilloides]
MGVLQSKHNKSNSSDLDDSDKEIDEADFSKLCNNTNRSSQFTLIQSNQSCNMVLDSTVSFHPCPDEIFIYAFNNMDIADKISLIYLLYDDASIALQDMTLIVNGSQKNIIQNYMQSQSSTNAKDTIIEALAIIQDYSTLKILGMSKNNVEYKFHLQNMSSIYVNQIRKHIYLLLEKFDLTRAEQFINYVNNDMYQSHSFQVYPYLEMYFSYFETIKFISKTNFANILKVLKYMELDEEYDELKLIISQTENSNTFQNMKLDEMPVPNNASDTSYIFDPDHPGICLIFDIECFYTEINPMYKNLFTPLSEKLKDRQGTKFDSNRLKEVFENFNFKVLLQRNKTHVEMISIIQDTLNQVKKEDSSLFIIFLSHGIKGKVFASNSIPLEIEQIKKKMTHCRNLKDKPKVLIMQSCQGTEIYTENRTESNLTTDGPSMEWDESPDVCDILEIWSTVPGYASFRDINKGTWFIQTLCDVIENNNEEHLLDMCIRMQNIIKNKKGMIENGVIGKMAIEYTATFSKKIYFPPKK